MGNVGRIVCVSVPFILSVVSLILLLIATLGGVTDKNLHVFRLETANLTISTNILDSVLNRRDDPSIMSELHDAVKNLDTPSELVDRLKEALTNGSTTITAADLELADSYTVSLWGYCAFRGEERNCSKPEYNWAAKMNLTALENISNVAGDSFNVPDALESGVKTFVTLTRWTEIAFIAAILGMALQIVIGAFSSCSRMISCVTYLVGGLATIFVIIAASLATATAAVITQVSESTKDEFGVDGEMNNTFLGLVWASVLFCIGAGLFWLVSVCCCAPDRRHKGSKHSPSAVEHGHHKYGSYQQVEGGYHGAQYNPSAYANQNHAAQKYEPYSSK